MASDLDANGREAGVDGARVEIVAAPGLGIVRPSLGDDVSFFRNKMKEARGGGQESNRGRGCVVAWDGIPRVEAGGRSEKFCRTRM